MIDWASFDWQSFSTLFTGVLAVGAAMVVGLRQAQISAKQTDILAQQVELEKAKLRADLFERRMATFEATVDFVLYIDQLPEDDPRSEERQRRFFEKMRESQFIFRREVYNELMAIWKKSGELRTVKATARQNYKDGISDRDIVLKLNEGPIWVLGKIDQLADLFAPDLEVGVDRFIY